MATTNQKVSAGELISATVRYNNYDDADRGYDIEADVNINGRKVNSFSRGSVKKHNDLTESSSTTFESWTDNQLQVMFQTATKEESVAILPYIYDFMSEVKSTVETPGEETV